MADVRARLMNKKAFLWDFDGCFADTERVHLAAYAKAFEKYGHRVDEVEYFERFTHLGLGAQGEIDAYKLSCRADDIARAKKLAYDHLITSTKVCVFQEVPLVIKKMKSLGAKVAIASNSSREEILTILRQNGNVLDDVDEVIGKLPHLQKKPAPDIFLHALEVLGVKAADAMVFEDSDRGLQAAERAGIEAIWIRTALNERFTSERRALASLSHAELLKLFQS